METATKQERVIINDRDIEILEMLFKYRVLIPEQLSDYYNISQSTLRKRMHKLYKSGYIVKGELHGYRVEQKRQGVYYRISGKGIAKLQNEAMSLKRLGEDLTRYTADSLRVKKEYVPYTIMANDLGIHLENYGWQYKDSRMTKEGYGMNRNARLIGSLINTERTEHVFYGYKTKLAKTTFTQLGIEIIEHPHIQHVIATTKGGQAFKQILEYLTWQCKAKNNSNVVSNVTSFSLFDYDFVKLYLSAFDTNEKCLKFILSLYHEYMELIPNFTYKRRYDTLDTLIHFKENGESTQEYYLVNLLDTNLVKIRNLLRYTKEAYEQENNRKVLIITTHELFDTHKELFSNGYPHMKFLKVDTQYIKKYVEQQ